MHSLADLKRIADQTELTSEEVPDVLDRLHLYLDQRRAQTENIDEVEKQMLIRLDALLRPHLSGPLREQIGKARGHMAILFQDAQGVTKLHVEPLRSPFDGRDGGMKVTNVVIDSDGEPGTGSDA